MDNDQLKRIESKVDKVLDHVSSLDITAARHDEQLKEHLRRSKAAEDSIKLMERSHMRYALAIIGALAAIIFESFFRK
jgi:hypothetical protein